MWEQKGSGVDLGTSICVLATSPLHIRDKSEHALTNAYLYSEQ